MRDQNKPSQASYCGPQGRFQFTGQMWIPEVGLYYFKARLYAATLGRFMQTDPIGYEGGLNLHAYVGGDPINRRDPMGTMEEVIVPGRPGCGYDCNIYQPPALQDFALTPEQWDLFEAQVMANLQSALLELTIDEVVVTAKKKKQLADVPIDMTLKFPAEQMWAVLQDGKIVPVPTVATVSTDSCNNEVGANKVVPGFTLPAGSHVVAIIHTHASKWAAGFPAAGDYDTAQLYAVYGIWGSGSWVLRHGAAPGANTGCTSTPRVAPEIVVDTHTVRIEGWFSARGEWMVNPGSGDFNDFIPFDKPPNQRCVSVVNATGAPRGEFAALDAKRVVATGVVVNYHDLPVGSTTADQLIQRRYYKNEVVFNSCLREEIFIADSLKLAEHR